MEKEQNYLHGAAILTAGVIVIKILGAIYKIPIGNLLGDDGYGLFLSAYSVYAVFLSLATAGLPVALSRMISESHAEGRLMQTRRTFSVAIRTFFVLGLISTLIMLLFPDKLAELLHNPDASLSIRVLAPSVLLVCLTSAYRGYAQGHGNMIPTTVGQIIEVLVKVIVGLLLAWYLVSRNASVSFTSAAAIFGVTVGSLAVLVYMYICKKRMTDSRTVAKPDVPEARAEIFKNLLRIGIPIALGSIVLSLINLLDSGLCMARLQGEAGFSYLDAKILYGVYGKAQTLFSIPAAFITPLTISIVPAIAAEIAKKNKKEAAKISEDSLRISMAMALPMGVGLAVISEPVMKVLYPGAHESGSALLFLLAIASVFVCFSLMTTAVLQATGKERLTAYSIIAGGLVKIAVNWVLVGIPGINIYGAPIGTLACYVTMCLLNLIFIARSVERAPSFINIFVKPTVTALVMGEAAYLVYYGIGHFLDYSGRIYMTAGMCIAVGVAVIIYAFTAIKLRVITAADMKLIPKGEKIAKLLKMH